LTIQSPHKTKPIILGAGVCGLAIAWRLHQNKSTTAPLIIEKEDRPGGLARSISLGNQVADMGPHRLHTEIQEVDEFLKNFAGDQLETVKRQSQMYIRGRWIEYPPKPFEILRVFGPIKLFEVLLSFTFGKIIGSAPKVDSFESVMTTAFGSELYRLIVLDYTKKVWKISPKKIHGDIARVRVSAGGLQQLIKRVFVPEQQGKETALKKFRYLPGGVETLIKGMSEECLKKGTEISCSEHVEDIYRENDQWHVVTKDSQDNIQTRTSNQIYSTIPVTELCTHLLKRKPDAKVQQAINESKFIANFLVVLQIKKNQISKNQWLYFPGKETIFNRGYEPKNFSETMGEKGSSLLILEITCYEGDKIWNASDKKIIRQTIRDLEKIDFVSSDQIMDSMMVRIPHTYPLYDLEYKDRTNIIWNYLKQFPGLVSVGRQGLFLHNNMDHSIYMGFQAADLVLKENEKATDTWYDQVEEFQSFRIVD